MSQTKHISPEHLAQEMTRYISGDERYKQVRGTITGFKAHHRRNAVEFRISGLSCRLEFAPNPKRATLEVQNSTKPRKTYDLDVGIETTQKGNLSPKTMRNIYEEKIIPALRDYGSDH